MALIRAIGGGGGGQGQLVTITLHGALEDIITFTDASGLLQTITFESGQSSKQVQLYINIPSSNITFTSLIAKSPSNPTQNYAESKTIFYLTTDVYLRPENALYWFGYGDSNLEDCISSNGYTAPSGYSLLSSTHNKNNITYTSGGARITFVGTKQKISFTKFHQIIELTSGDGVVYGASNDKVMDASHYASWEGITTANVPTSVSHDYGSQVSYYIRNGGMNGSNGILYAMWYE